jgi:hypothetical protein
VHRQLFHQVAEVLGTSDEVRFAVHLHEHADAAAHVDVAADDALGGGAAGALGGGGESRLAEQGDGLFHVATGIGERLLALHHAGAGPVAKLLDQGCCDLCHVVTPIRRGRRPALQWQGLSPAG